MKEIEEVLLEKVPKIFLQDLNENIPKAAEAALNKCKSSIGKGYYFMELGQQRSYLISNELYLAAKVHGFLAVESKGNSACVVDINGINFVRVNLTSSSGKQKIVKNRTSEELSAINVAIESHIQGDLFDQPHDINGLFVCVVSRFVKGASSPYLIELVVPSSDGKSILYRVALGKFLMMYESKSSLETTITQDKAYPKLKVAVKTMDI